MTPLGAKKLKREKTATRTREILDAASRLFCERGFEKTGIIDIAASAGVAEGTIYKHFDSKKNLLYAVVIDYYIKLGSQMRSDLSRMEDYEDKIRHIIWVQLDSMDRNPGMANLFIRDVRGQSDYFDSEILTITRDYTNVLVEVVAEGIQKGAFNPAYPTRMVRYVVYGAIEHLVLRYLSDGGALDVDRMVEGIAQAVFAGLRAPAAGQQETALFERLDAAIARLEGVPDPRSR